MSVEVQTSVNVQGTIDYTAVAANVIQLYTDPWFVMSIGMTFGFGMLMYLILKSHFPRNIWVTNLLIITGAELLFGYGATIALVDSIDEHRLAMITGFNAAAIYWVADYLSEKFGMVRIQAWLHLRQVITLPDGSQSLGETVQFTVKRK